MCDAAHEQTEARAANQVAHAHQHRDGKADDDEAVVRQREVGEHLHAAAHPRGVFHAHVLRAEQAAHQLHQHQADAPGGEQCLQRAAVQKAQHATLQHSAHQGRCEKGQRHRSHQVPVESAWKELLEHALHHVGGVGADHHQLAVGHVDHAHEAVGDGQAQRHQQQDGAQADARKRSAQALAPGQLVVQGAQRGLQGSLDLGVFLHRHALVQQQARVGRGAGRQGLRGSDALRGIVAAQQGGGTRQLQLGLDLVAGFLRQGFIEQRQAACVRLFGQCLGGSHALGFVLAKQRQARQGRVDLAAHAVVVDDVFGIGRQRHLGAGDGVDALVVPHDQGLATGHLHRIIGQRLQIGGGALAGVDHGLLHGGHAVVGVASGHGQGLLGGEGVRLYRRAQQKAGDQTGKKRGIHDGGSLKSQWAAAQARCEGESRRARAA